MDSQKNILQNGKLINQCYSVRTSYVFPILQIKDEKCVNYYISNSFINVLFDSTYIDFFEFDIFYEKKGLFEIVREPISRMGVLQNQKEIDSYFFKRINDGYHLVCHCDIFYFRGLSSYQRIHLDKEIMVVDYNHDNKEYLIVTVLNCGLVYTSVSIDSLIQALTKLESVDYTIISIKFNNHHPLSIDTDKIKQDINDYLSSNNRFLFFPHSNASFGIKAVLSFQDYLESTLINNEVIDTENLCVIVDHKKLFMERLFFLERMGVITNNDWGDKYFRVYKVVDDCLNVCKNNWDVNSNRNSLKQIIECSFNRLISIEAEVLSSLLKNGFVK